MSTLMKIIDNKKISLTEDEYNMYKQICASYTIVPSQKGEDFFVDLFETDNDGLIVFLRPPSKRQVSLEIFLFMMSIMANQHLRAVHTQVNDLCKKMNEKISELDIKLAQIK